MDHALKAADYHSTGGEKSPYLSRFGHGADFVGHPRNYKHEFINVPSCGNDSCAQIQSTPESMHASFFSEPRIQSLNAVV